MTRGEDVRTRAVQQIFVSLAGRVGERRAARPDADGWVRCRSEKSRIAFHESAHAVVASLSFDWEVTLATILPDRTIKLGRSGSTYSAGHVRCRPKGCPVPEPYDSETPASERRSFTDIETVARFAWLTADVMSWKATLRLIRNARLEVEKQVEIFWPEICALADELEANGTLDAAEISRIARRWIDGAAVAA